MKQDLELLAIARIRRVLATLSTPSQVSVLQFVTQRAYTDSQTARMDALKAPATSGVVSGYIAKPEPSPFNGGESRSLGAQLFDSVQAGTHIDG